MPSHPYACRTATATFSARRNYERYRDESSRWRGVKMAQCEPAERSTYPYIVLEVDEEEAGLSRDRLLSVVCTLHWWRDTGSAEWPAFHARRSRAS